MLTPGLVRLMASSLTEILKLVLLVDALDNALRISAFIPKPVFNCMR